MISEVTDNSPAKKSGLKQGDIITAINGVAITGSADLRNKVAMTPPKTKLKMDVLRNGKQETIEVTIGEQPGDMATLAKNGSSATLSAFGLSVQNLTNEVAEQFGYKKDQGVLIADVEADSPAAQVNLQAGNLIEEVNKVRVHNLKELQAALKKSSNPKRVLLRVRAGEYSQYIVLQIQ